MAEAVSGTCSFSTFFERACGHAPFPVQMSFATELHTLVHVPTGLGKTAMAVIGWLWRRQEANSEIRSATPRRLVYCLPMRVLVEQTRDNAIRWLYNLNRLDGDVTFNPELRDGAIAKPNHRISKYKPRTDDANKIAVYVLMGGEDEDDWDIHPEREAIIIGTQDMLLSRALNRGYAAARSRWPMQFGLLHTDCLWVFDEIQLMGAGLATTAQLEAFRRLLPRGNAEAAKNGHGCKSVWMSATLRPEWLATVDFKPWIDNQGRIDGKDALSLSNADLTNKQVCNRWNAEKPLTKAASAVDDAAGLANEVRDAHKPGTRTIVVVNTVKRAYALYDALTAHPKSAAGQKRRARNNAPLAAAAGGGANNQPRIVLLHSRFRPPDRAERVAEVLAEVDENGPGTIIVSTQVIEAGVDVSAATLFTELAPWASLVQRFGRCNRLGENNGHACVCWIDVPDKDAAPYQPEDLKEARETLRVIGESSTTHQSVSPAALSRLNITLPFNHTDVLRRRDLLDLFDTTPDLAGNDIDIDRFVREVDDSDVRVFWRDYGDPAEGATPNKIGGRSADAHGQYVEAAPRPAELCPVPIGEFRNFAKNHRDLIWRWNFLEGSWKKADAAKITPGQVFLIHADAAGYLPSVGWMPASTVRVSPILPHPSSSRATPEATDADLQSQIGMSQSIDEHTDMVCKELATIIGALQLNEDSCTALSAAARWHDLGKAHKIFQAALPDGIGAGFKLLAKAAGQWKRYKRSHFRHELASALAVLQRPHQSLMGLSDGDLNLVAYLIAAHHGKVRLSIRSLPNEDRPNPRMDGSGRERRFARGVWEGDELPETDLGHEGNGGRVISPRVTLSLEPMEMGLCEQPPFVGQPSWAERMTRLHEVLGPFHLAYLEAILRAADSRASIIAVQQRIPTAAPAVAGPISSSATAPGQEGAHG